LVKRGERKLIKKAVIQKKTLKHIGNFLNNGNFLQGNKDSSCSSALRGENYFETGKGKKIKVVEVYGDKPIDEVLEAFSKYISQFF
jgi:phage-related protein